MAGSEAKLADEHTEMSKYLVRYRRSSEHFLKNAQEIYAYNDLIVEREKKKKLSEGSMILLTNSCGGFCQMPGVRGTTLGRLDQR